MRIHPQPRRWADRHPVDTPDPMARADRSPTVRMTVADAEDADAAGPETAGRKEDHSNRCHSNRQAGTPRPCRRPSDADAVVARKVAADVPAARNAPASRY